MKLSKMLKKAEELLSSKKSKQMAKKADLKTLVHKLRKKEKALKAELADAKDDDTRKHLESKIALAHSQRKKGIKALAALKD